MTVNNSSGERREFLLMAMEGFEFEASAKILEDLNVFIGDTGASSDTTVSDLGFRNVRQANAEDNIVDVSGNVLNEKSVGDLYGSFCNKHGEEVGQATIKDMVYTPRAGYNLFSLTKRLDDG